MYTCTVNTTGDYCIINCLFYILLKSLYSLCSALCEWSQPISAHRSRRQIFLILLQWNFIHLLFSFSFLPLFARWRLFCADSLRSQVSHVCHRVTWLLPLLTCYCLIIYSVILHSLSPPSLTLNVLTEQKRTFQPEVTCFTGARIYLYSTNIKAEHMDTCDPGFFTGASFLYLK